MYKTLLTLPLLLAGCVSFDVQVVDAPPAPPMLPAKGDPVPAHPGKLVLIPYPKKPSLGNGVKDHNEIENILIKHINELHRVNQLNINRVHNYGK